MAVPFAYLVARTSNGQSVVVVGTDFERIQKLNRWWSVSAWPSGSGEALVGMRALSVVSPDGKAFDLSFQGHTTNLKTAGTLQTGAAEDSRVYLPMAEFSAWSGIHPSTIEIAANGTAEEINGVVSRLAEALPVADVRPVRQIVEGEARVLGKTRATLYAAAILIVLTAALCVLATLTGWVFDRRKDFAIMKALGASEGLVSGFFAAEAAALGAVGRGGRIPDRHRHRGLDRPRQFQCPGRPALQRISCGARRKHRSGAAVGDCPDDDAAACTTRYHLEGRVKVIKLKNVSRLYPAKAEENGGTHPRAR